MKDQVGIKVFDLEAFYRKLAAVPGIARNKETKKAALKA